MPEFLAKFYRRIETALGSGVMRRAPVPYRDVCPSLDDRHRIGIDDRE